MLVNRKLLGWITISVYHKKPRINVRMKIMSVNRKLLGWAIYTGITSKIGITFYNEDDAGKPQITN